MLCHVEQDLHSNMNAIDSNDIAFEYWKWCFESELKFLNKFITNGRVILREIDEVKECIDTLFEESKSFNYKDSNYDFSEDLQVILDNF